MINMTGKKLESYNFLNQIGSGSFGTVYQAIDQRDGNQIAIKVIDKKKIKMIPKLQELVQTEIRVLEKCKNQNIIKFVDSFLSDKYVFIAIEFCNGGDMEEYLETKKRLTEDQAVEFLKQILNGFKGLHQVGAMHRDFKLANILLNNGECKIADLGLAKQIEEKTLTTTFVGTYQTMAPQVLNNEPYGIQADIWSIGVVYYQLIYGKYPYQKIDQYNFLEKIKNSPDFSEVQISQNSKDFINRCLTIKPTKRITWAQIYSHALLNNKAGLFYNMKQQKINMVSNQSLYENGDIKIQKELMYAEQNMNDNQKFNVFWQDAGQVQISVNIEKLIHYNQVKKKLEQNFIKYEKQYLTKRNNIMFIFKFITPFLEKLLQLQANHSLIMFICTKNAYLEIQNLCSAMKKKQNIFKLQQNWKQFVQSLEYIQIKKQIKNDKKMIQIQGMSYQMDIDKQFCNQEIKAQLQNLQYPSSQNWAKLVNQLLKKYWFLLTQRLLSEIKVEKRHLIRVLQALQYVFENSKISAEEFAKYMETIKWDEAQESIMYKYNSVLQ